HAAIACKPSVCDSVVRQWLPTLRRVPLRAKAATRAVKCGGENHTKRCLSHVTHDDATRYALAAELLSPVQTSDGTPRLYALWEVPREARRSVMRVLRQLEQGDPDASERLSNLGRGALLRAQAALSDTRAEELAAFPSAKRFARAIAAGGQHPEGPRTQFV